MQIALLGRTFGEQLLKLLNRLFGKTLRHRYHAAGLQAGQFALVLNGQFGRAGQLLLELDQLLLVITLIVELCQRALQDGLQGLLIGFRQFAVGDLVQACLYGFTGGRFGGLYGTDREAQAQQDHDEKGAQA
ncbi:hypothetical protein D3C76_1368880 [compost metagenome]